MCLPIQRTNRPLYRLASYTFTQKASFALAADVAVSQLVHHASTYDFGNLASVFWGGVSVAMFVSRLFTSQLKITINTRPALFQGRIRILAATFAESNSYVCPKNTIRYSCILYQLVRPL